MASARSLLTSALCPLPFALAGLLFSTSSCAERVEAGTPRQVRLNTRPVQFRVPDGWGLIGQTEQVRFVKGAQDAKTLAFQPGQSNITLKSLWLPYGQSEFADWGRAKLDGTIGTIQREIKSRWVIQIDGRQAVEMETWDKVDHSFPERMLLIREDRDVIAMSTFGTVDADMLKAFTAIRDSIRFARR